MGTIIIATFGEPQLWHNQQVVFLPSRKALALLLYLAVTDQTHTRPHLIDLLWPDSDEIRGQQNLRQILHRLRQAFVPDAHTHLDAIGQRVRLHLGQEDSIDVKHLYAATLPDAPLPQRLTALQMYQGSFLRGITLDDAPGFMAWVTTQRAYWATIYDVLAEREMQDLLESGHTQEASAIGQTWVAHHPDTEAAYRFLAKAQAASGNASGARLTLAKIEQHFADQDIPLSAETEALRARLATLRPAFMTKPLLKLPLVGRREAFQQMRLAYQASVRGSAGMVMVQGEAGMGKTRLVDAFLQWGQMQGADVALGHAYELSGRLPYQPLMELLQQRLAREHALDDVLEDGWLIELQRLIPDIHQRYPDLPLPSDDSAAGTRLLEAIAQVGIALGRHHPVIWVMEDLHWADDATRDGLLYVLERWRTEATPVLLVATLRQEELANSLALGTWVAALHRTTAVIEVPLTALTLRQTTQAMNTLLGETTHPTLHAWCHAETQGNPLYLQHILQSLLERGFIVWQDNTLHLMEAVETATFTAWLPETLRGLLLQRVRRLNLVTQQVLAAATVVGTCFREDLLMQVAGVEEEVLLTAWESAERGLLISAKTGVYGFAHDEVAQALYEDLSVARRRSLHRRALQALIMAGQAPAADLLRHALGAEAWEEAIRYAEQAAEAADHIGAHIDELRFRKQIVHLLTTPPSQAILQVVLSDDARSLHFAQLGMKYLNLGKVEQAHAYYQALLTEARAIGARFEEGQALLLLGEVVYLYEHDPATARGMVEMALQILADMSAVRWQMRAQMILTDVLIALDDLPQIQATIERGMQ